MDTLFVEGLEVYGKHGVMDHERSHEQCFSVDIRATVDITKSAATDELSDSVNYVDLCAIAERTIKGTSLYLIEKMATLIADEILRDTRISQVEVTVRKPTVLPSGVPGVTILRSQVRS